MSDGRVSMLCRYRVRAGQEAAFAELLSRHWKTLREAGLVTGDPARVYRASDKSGNVAFVEMFAWKSAESSGVAHQTESVMALWEPMGQMCEGMEFWQVEEMAFEVGNG